MIVYLRFRYNCQDPNCYFDLARLTGVKYVTWENNDKLIQHDHKVIFFLTATPIT